MRSSRARVLHRAGRPWPPVRLASLAAGVAVLIASILALAAPARRLLYWHTLERLLIGDPASLLIAIGLAGIVSSARRRAAPRRPFAPLSRPQIALPLWAANLVVWQLPGPFDAAMRHHWLHLIDDALLVGMSVNMWMALLLAGQGARPLGHLGRIAYVAIGRMVGAALACVAIWSPDVYYPYYLRGDSLSSISPLADQGIAGAIMLAEMALVAIALLCFAYAQLGREGQDVPAPADLQPVQGAGVPAPAELQPVQAGAGALPAELPAPQTSAGALAVDAQA